MLRLEQQTQSKIREFVTGILLGISMCNKTRSEILGEDFWLQWSEGLTINLVEDDDGDWQCAVYRVEYNTVVDTEWHTIKLTED